MTGWSCHIGRSSLAGPYPEHSELPCTLGMECGAIVPCFQQASLRVFFFFFGGEGEIFITRSNDSNLKEM